MLTLALVFLLGQEAPCAGDAAKLYEEGRREAAALELSGAASSFQEAADAGCGLAGLAAAYLTGLAAARDAYREGGSVASLEPVRRAEAVLSRTAHPLSEAAGVVLMAAAAAAQSEREDMATLLAHALHLERLHIAAGAGPLPGVSAHEAAGDLWLQVHRFETARAAYRQAEELLGSTLRTSLGLARVAVRLDNRADACRAYERVMTFGQTGQQRPHHLEARDYLTRRCR